MGILHQLMLPQVLLFVSNTYNSSTVIICLFKLVCVVSVGSSETSLLNARKKVASSAWGIPRATDVFHDSSDISLFSSSLPVLPHEKCKHEMIFWCTDCNYLKYLFRIFPYFSLF